MELSRADTTILNALEDADIVLIPWREDEDGTGVYPEASLTLAKHLRLEQVNVAFAHDSESRSWLQLLGHGEVSLIAAIALNVVGSASWDLVRAGFARWIDTLEEGTRLNVKIELYSPSGKKREALEIRGRASQVLRALNDIPEAVRRIRANE